MRVSSTAAEAANNSTNGHSKPNSPALAQLKAAIEPNALEGSNGSNSQATAVMEGEEDTSEADQVDQVEGKTHCITVPMPTECQTKIKLLLEFIPDPKPAWIAGFRVVRSYDCEPFDAFYTEKPDNDATEEDMFADLGSAVGSAAERASWWLVTNTGDTETDPIGCKADEALGNWRRELDTETITRSYFDDPTKDAEEEGGVNQDNAGDDAGEDVEFVRIGQPDIATETMDSAQVAPVVAPVAAPNPVPAIIAKSITDAIYATPDPYDPIEEVDEEIAKIGERIVAHSCKISELDAALKAEKKSWKTGADELVALHVRKANLLLSKNEREKEKAERDARDARAAITRTLSPTLDPSRPQTDLTCLGYRESATESTEAHAARIAEAFAPAPATATNLSPTPDQERYDQEFRSLAMDGLDGLTPKILEILHANNIYTVGAWQDVPKRGIEYTQLSAGGAKLTEARFEKVMDAMMAYMKANPRPEREGVEAVEAADAEKPAASVMNSLDVDDI